MPPIVKTLDITDDTPPELLKVDRAVQSLVGMSRAQVVGLFDRQCVNVNGAACGEPWQRLSSGDRIEVRYHIGQKYPPLKRKLAPTGFAILHEDEQIIVVDKPADCLTTPTPARETNTLIDRVACYLSNGNRKRPTIFAVSRLDRGVSGVLVFAKSGAARDNLQAQFAAHEPEREYLAIVVGRLASAEGVFRSHLTTSKSLKRYSIADPAQGELAVTHFATVANSPGATVVRVWLETGRRNQIRVHFAEAGHPVLGDRRYEPELAQHGRWRHRRLALHAAALSLRHPQSGERLCFEAAAPEEFRQFLGRDSAEAIARLAAKQRPH